MSRLTRAFTLLELLVVLGIVTLLIAILLPALRKARQQAQMIVCQSNERQIYAALVMYMQDYKGVLPIPPRNSGFPQLPNQVCMMTDLSAYDYSNGVLWTYIPGGPDRRQELFLCPSDGPDRPRVLTDSIPPILDPSGQRNFTYDFNFHMCGSLTGTLVMTDRGLFPGYSGLKLSRVMHPDERLLILETDNPRGGDDTAMTISGVTGLPACLLSKRHFSRSNQCFADGHVELFDPNQMLVRIPGQGRIMAQVYMSLDPGG